MADVASMQKDETTPAAVAVVPTAMVALQSVDDDETDTDDEMSPVLHSTSSQVTEIEVEADVPSPATSVAKFGPNEKGELNYS